MAQPLIDITKVFRFEASHVLPKHPGKCARLHGHSWVLRVTVRGTVDPETGFVLDYADLSEIVKERIIDKLDHQHLGQETVIEPHIDNRTYHAVLGDDFYPSSENLLMWIVVEIRPYIDRLNGVWLQKVSLDETCTSQATWRAS